MTNKTETLVSAVEQELINRVPHMTVNDLLQTYSQASYISPTEPVEPTLDDNTQSVSCIDKVESADTPNTTKPEPETETQLIPDTEDEEETLESETKTAKKKARKTAKKKAKKAEPEPVVETTDSDEHLLDLDDAYEEARQAYDKALKRGVDSEQFMAIVKRSGYKSIDNVKDVNVMIGIRDATNELEAL